MNKIAGETGALHLAIGWLEPGSSRRDAVDYARGYAQKYFDSVDACWYVVMPFMDGWFYEVQEGGSGRSYLPAVAKALAAGEEDRWVRVGTRVMSIGLREGRPFCVLMSESDSRSLTDDTKRLQATTPMQRVIKRGTGMLLSGTVVAFSGLLFLLATSGFYLLQQTAYIPSTREINLDLLPHLQWDRVGSVPPNLYVEKLEMAAGADRWETSVKPIQRAATDAPSADALPSSTDAAVATPVVPVVDESAAIAQDVPAASSVVPADPIPGPEALPVVSPQAPLPAAPAAIPVP